MSDYEGLLLKIRVLLKQIPLKDDKGKRWVITGFHDDGGVLLSSLDEPLKEKKAVKSLAGFERDDFEGER